MLPSPSGSEPIMEGTLWKWTNYLSGWQPRWFILEAGTLSYYLSPNEVHLGSRGSLKISSCDIIVHSSDHQRMDMTMPGGRQLFLRAASRSERQQWLLALGVAKQGGMEPESSHAKNLHRVAMEKKMDELHSNCHLLVSQITSIQDITSDLVNTDSKVLSDLSSQVSMSCEQFLKVLQECMNLTLSHQLRPSLKPLPLQHLYPPGGGISPVSTKSSGFSEAELYPPSSHPPPSPLTHKPKHRKTTPTLSEATPILGMSTSFYSLDTANFSPESVSHTDSSMTESKSTSDLFITPISSPQNTPPHSPKAHPLPSRIGDRVMLDHAESARTHDTFFSSLLSKFEDIKLEGEGLIPTDRFLYCCHEVVPFFDTLNSTAFAPVKADITGNITKLRTKLNTDPVRYSTLQAMILAEITDNTHNQSNSATDALLWLKRAMEFVQHFIGEVSNGEHSLDVAASRAYTLSLRKYHGWIIRGVFNLALKAVPYHKDFLALLGSPRTNDGDKQVLEDMELFSASLREIVNILNQFYLEHNLNPSP